MNSSNQIIWKAFSSLFTPADFGKGHENLRPELLVLLFSFRQYITNGGKIIITKGSHRGGKAVHFRIAGGHGDFQSHVDMLESFLEKRGLKNWVGIGIYPEIEQPDIHLEVEDNFKQSPRRWGAKYKRDVDGLFLRDGLPVEEVVSYECARKKTNELFRV